MIIVDRRNPFDPDAQAYITAVEAADGQSLEAGVRAAYNGFFVGCKADGVFSALKACCILAGARTLGGALVPLVGSAPTNNNFASGDYNRETGLLGNGSNKWLNSNRNNNADPQDSHHLSVHVTTFNTRTIGRTYIGAGVSDNGSSQILSGASGVNTIATRSRTTGFAGTGNVTQVTGFIGISRGSSASYVRRYNGSDATITATSQTPLNQNIAVFGRNLAAEADGRIAFYSIGENLNLALLEARVTTLIDAIAAAIP